MWILYAFGSALFAGLTTIAVKCGIKKTDSTVATAIRTPIVLVMSLVMVLITGSIGTVRDISAGSWVFLILSGLATGASWLCYFRALQLGQAARVAAVDKSSTVLTILFAFILLGEPFTWLKGIGVLAIGVGIFLMMDLKKGAGQVQGKSWLLFAALSAVFASLTAILGKLGIQSVESNLGTAIRTAVVAVMAWGMVFITGKGHAARQIPKRELGFICLSGLITGLSWLCFYKALKDGPASIVVPIDKLSILVTAVFSGIFLGERFHARNIAGLLLITAGTLCMLL